MNHLFLRAALGISLFAASIVPATAQAIPPGSYQQSCTDIRVRGYDLSASCTAPNGGRVRSTIGLTRCQGGDIANVNGRLTCNGGSYNGNMYGNRRHHHRHHRHGHGDYDDNGNDNGNYNGNGYGGGYGGGYGYAPGGSYQQSCRNIRANGGLITASCPDGRGNYITTSIDARQCRGADIANRNGRLSCG